jgi:hypothetical protein
METVVSPHFLKEEPFARARSYAARYHCDLAVPSYMGLGSQICYTPLVEAQARRLGRPLRLLTGPSDSAYGRNPDEELAFPIWENNPYVAEIVNAEEIDSRILEELSEEMDNYCQFGHVIENICAPYGLRPRRLAGSLYLSSDEMRWGLEALAHLERPVVCLCPYGRSASPEGSPWYRDRWLELVAALAAEVGFFQTGHDDFQTKALPVWSPPSTVRQSMALIWASDVYVGFDTGPSHVATALAVPAAVLWDAPRKARLKDPERLGFAIAHMSRWAYPQNRNLVILHERHGEVLASCIDFVRDTVSRFVGRHALAPAPRTGAGGKPRQRVAKGRRRRP